MPRHELQTYSYPHNLQNRVNHIRQYPDRPIIAQSKDIDEYINAVFNGVSTDNIYVQGKTRPSEGFGAHFDTYNHRNTQLLDKDFPYIATFNKQGSFVLRATALSEALTNDYDRTYPDQTRDAHRARRHLGDYALNNPNADIYTHVGSLGKNSGIIIPQVPRGPYVVHEVTPSPRITTTRSGNYSGSFLKFLVPADTDEALGRIKTAGYITYAEFTAKQEQDRKAQNEWLDSIDEHEAQHFNGSFIGDADELRYD